MAAACDCACAEHARQAGEGSAACDGEPCGEAPTDAACVCDGEAASAWSPALAGAIES